MTSTGLVTTLTYAIATACAEGVGGVGVVLAAAHSISVRAEYVDGVSVGRRDCRDSGPQRCAAAAAAPAALTPRGRTVIERGRHDPRVQHRADASGGDDPARGVQRARQDRHQRQRRARCVRPRDDDDRFIHTQHAAWGAVWMGVGGVVVLWRGRVGVSGVKRGGGAMRDGVTSEIAPSLTTPPTHRFSRMGYVQMDTLFSSSSTLPVMTSRSCFGVDARPAAPAATTIAPATAMTMPATLNHDVRDPLFQYS